MGEISEGLEQYQLGLSSSEDGNPDYYPVLLLELAINEQVDLQKRKQLFVESADLAISRARHLDKKRCIENALWELEIYADRDDKSLIEIYRTELGKIKSGE